VVAWASELAHVLHGHGRLRFLRALMAIECG